MGNFPVKSGKFTFHTGKFPSQGKKYPQIPVCIPMAGSFNQQLSRVFAWKMGSYPETDCVKL